MIRQLSISNYALIDKLEISFPVGLTIITGETGAGKSILLGALGLIIGQRADTGALQDKTKKCAVEAVFDLSRQKLEAFFKTNELDYEAHTIIRREINPEGKSRAFINDTPVTLTVLKELGEQLIDIHSQHQTRTLSDSDFQLSVIDLVAGNAIALQAYQEEYKAFRSLQTALLQMKEKEAASKRDLDYFQFQFKELDEARLDTIALEALEAELELLTNAEEIKAGMGKAAFALHGGDLNMLSTLAEIKSLVGGLARYNPSIARLSERIGSSFIELKDIAAEIEASETEIVFDPKRVEEINERLDACYRLFQKHQVKSLPELIQLRNTLSEQLLGISSLEHEIAVACREMEKLRLSLLKKAGALAEKRKEASPNVEKEVIRMLAQLGMPAASLQVKVSGLPEETFGNKGTDRVNFLFSANKGSEPKELNKVASGGELSRLMLSIKSIIAQKTALPTLIFDEIDTGVSGDIADKMGTIMEAMASGMQVVTITHLPQIASKAGAHLFVYKQVDKNKTLTQIRTLSGEERITEIAKMLSTGQPTPAALKNAKELLNS
jgi:DNA repair protein RecN (Recombination protein N)